MADTHDTAPTPPTPPSTATPRRWPRRLLIAAAVSAALVGGALWLLGREATLQQLVQRLADASGGQIAVHGVSGSLYHRMHIGQLVYRSKDSVVTAADIDINWSPLQYFSGGLSISELHVASLLVRSTGPSEPAKLPASLAAPFKLSLADARLDTLTLQDNAGAANVVRGLRFALDGDRVNWRLRGVKATTEIGLLDADLTIGMERPFALDGKASLTQAGAPGAGAAKPARATVQARGSLALIDLAAQGAAGAATGEASMQVAPFDPVILRAIDITARGIDPAAVREGLPKAGLSLKLTARIDQQQRIGGQLAVLNQARSAPLDQQGLPLQGLSARIDGTLTATRIDGLTIDLGAAGRFNGGGTIARSAPDAGIDHASLALHTDRLDLKALHGSANKTAIAGDITLASKGGRQMLAAALAQEGLRLDLRATLADALLRVEQARLQAKHGSISATGQASLKEQQAFKASLRAEHFDPAALGHYPAADLNLDAGASGTLSPHWQLAANVALKPSRLLGQPLTGDGAFQADARHVSGVDARLALGRNTAAVKGSFGAPGEQLRWNVEARQLSAVGGDLQGAVSASGIVSGSMAAPRSSFEADARGLALASAKRPANDSLLHASGEVWLASLGTGAGARRQPALKLDGTAQRFSPAAFGPYPDGSINAAFNAQAALAQAWHAGVNLTLQPSTLSGAPLSGHARLNAAAGRIDSTDIDLRLGPNSLQAKGGFGSPRDKLEWKLDAPQLAVAGPAFGGALHAAGALSGSVEKPALTLTMDGARLRLPGQQQIGAVNGSATLGRTPALADKLASLLPGADDVPVVSDIEIKDYASPSLTLGKLRLQTSGTRSAHVLQLSAGNRDFDAALRLKGGWREDSWTGVVDTLQNRGRFALTLQAPAALRVAGPAGAGVAGLLHPEQIALGAAVVKLPAGAVRIDSLEKIGPAWRSKGQADGVPVNYLAQLSDDWRDNVKSDMSIGATWAMHLQAAGPSGPAAVDGALHLYREQGDITMTGADLPLPLGLRALDARVDVSGGVLRGQLAFDGSRAGQARVDATVQLRDGHLADDSALTLSGSANMASLAWLAPLAGQPGMEMDGTLTLALTGSGTYGAPQLNGDISGDKLVLNWAEQGIKLRNGVLRARLAGDQLQLQKLAFDGAEGKAQADGWMRFANGEATMNLKLQADRLEVLARPDRTLVVSGQSTLTRDAKHFQLDGKFRADRADIELAGQDTPTMSDDVVIVGKRAAPAKGAQGMPLNIDVEADLGEAFHLKGHGLDAQLAGAVRIRVAERRPPRISGSIRVPSGTYAAYGQKLAIERGVINFTGAYDNPGLNILAVRKRPEGEALSETNVEAGVEVRGTALAPVAKLVSTPAVSDSDKLAWLVLGHGIDNAAGNDMALLSTAAGALFGGGQGKLANSLGVDELGVSQVAGTAAGQATGLQSTVVTVGKRLSARAYLSFEQGAGTATSLVKLRYKLNPRITLQFQTGTNNALDVLYTWAFD